jgi:hypothetical protein
MQWMQQSVEKLHLFSARRERMIAGINPDFVLAPGTSAL